ncbi:hypothetical protein PYCC9005_005444 [Savitreella phatthalungensis]
MRDVKEVARALVERYDAADGVGTAEYIMMLVENGRSVEEVTSEVVELVAGYDAAFTRWVVGERELPPAPAPAPLEDKKSSRVTAPGTPYPPVAPATADVVASTAPSPPQQKPAGGPQRTSARSSRDTSTMGGRTCRDWPGCPRGRSCAFVHPREEVVGASADEMAEEQRPLCRFGEGCTNRMCVYGHPSPAGVDGSSMVLEAAACEDGKDCKDKECSKTHPSPALNFPYRDTSSGLPQCRYTPCLNDWCRFAHDRGQKTMTGGNEGSGAGGDAGAGGGYMGRSFGGNMVWTGGEATVTGSPTVKSTAERSFASDEPAESLSKSK